MLLQKNWIITFHLVFMYNVGHTHTLILSALRLILYFVCRFLFLDVTENLPPNSHSCYIYVSLYCHFIIVVTLLICLPCVVLLLMYGTVKRSCSNHAPPPSPPPSLSVFLFLGLQLPWPQQLDSWGVMRILWIKLGTWVKQLIIHVVWEYLLYESTQLSKCTHLVKNFVWMVSCVRCLFHVMLLTSDCRLPKDILGTSLIVP